MLKKTKKQKKLENELSQIKGYNPENKVNEKINTYDPDDLFFHERDGVYSENLNTAMLLNSAIEFTATINAPSQFRDNVFHDTRGSRRLRYMLISLDPSRNDLIHETHITLPPQANVVIKARAVLGIFKQYKKLILHDRNKRLIPNSTIEIIVKTEKGQTGTIENNEDLTRYNINEKDIEFQITNTHQDNTIELHNITIDSLTHRPDNTKEVSIEMCVVKGLCEWKEVVDKDLARLERTKIPRNFVLNSQQMGYDSQGNIRNEMTIRFDQETEFKYVTLMFPFKGRTWSNLATWNYGAAMPNPNIFQKDKNAVFTWYDVNTHRAGEKGKPNSTRYKKEKMATPSNRAYIYTTEPPDAKHIFHTYANELIDAHRYSPHDSTGANIMKTESVNIPHNRLGPTHTYNSTTQRDSVINGTMKSNEFYIDDYMSSNFTISSLGRGHFYLGNIETNGGWRFKQITPTPAHGPAPITQLPREQDKHTPLKTGDSVMNYDIVRYPITPDSKAAGAIEDRGITTSTDMTQQFITTNINDHKRRYNITSTFEYPQMTTIGSQTSIGSYPIIHILGRDNPSLEFPYLSTIGVRLRVDGWVHKDDQLFPSISGFNEEIRKSKEEMHNTYESQKKEGKGTKTNRIVIDLWTIFKKLGYM